MKRFYLTTLLCAFLAPALAQTKKIDSLQTVIQQHTQTDTFRVNRLNDLAEELMISVRQLDSVANLSLALAERLNYPNGQARAMYIRARSMVYTRPEVARTLLTQALRKAESIDNKPLIANIARATGLTYMNEGNRAFPYLQRAVTVAKSTGQQTLIAGAMDDLGTYYNYHNNYGLALSWYFRALREAEKAHAAETEAGILHRIAGIYLDLTDYNRALSYLQRVLQKVGSETKDYEILALADIGNCYRLTGQYEKAIEALKRGLTISKAYKARPYYHTLPLEASLADTYERQGNAQALPFARRVLNNARNQQDSYGICWVSVTLGRYHLRAGNADSAIYYGRQADQLAQPNQNKIRLRDATRILAQAYAQRHDFVHAYAYQARYIDYQSSITNEEIIRKATAAQFDDQMSRQQSEIAFLNKTKQLQATAARQQQILVNFLAGFLLMLLILAWALQRSNRQKQRSNALLQHQKVEIETQRDQTRQALTELKDTQAQLVQREKMASLGELTAGIAHEIQNPLNFVNNFSEVSVELVKEIEEEREKGRDGVPGERDMTLEADLLSDLKNNLQKITHHGGRASAIVRGMLEHSRTGTGQRQLTNLNTLAEEYLKIAYHGLRAKDKSFNCELVTNFMPDVARVEVVPQELGRVLLNLYNNAFYAVQQRQKTAPPAYQPTVTVSTRQVNSKVEIHISDNGTGISDSVKAKIFQPFFTTKPTGEGTGLGLSLSYDIVTKGHKGSLQVESREGEGTEFVIKLPTAKVSSLA